MYVLPILHIPWGCNHKIIYFAHRCWQQNQYLLRMQHHSTDILWGASKKIYYSYMTLHVGWVGCNFNCIVTFKSSMCCRSHEGWVGCNFNRIFTFKSMCCRSLPSRMKHFSLVIHVIPPIPIPWDCAPKKIHYITLHLDVGWVGCDFKCIFTFSRMHHRSHPSRMKHFSLVIHVITHIPTPCDVFSYYILFTYFIVIFLT